MITLQWLYLLAGAMFAAFAILSAFDRSNGKRFGNAAFWGLMALSLLAGDRIGKIERGDHLGCIVAGWNGNRLADGDSPDRIVRQCRESVGRIGRIGRYDQDQTVARDHAPRGWINQAGFDQIIDLPGGSRNEQVDRRAAFDLGCDLPRRPENERHALAADRFILLSNFFQRITETDRRTHAKGL